MSENILLSLPEIQAIEKIKTVQNWKIGNCLDLLLEIPDKSMQMILTDLPYGTTNCEWDGVLKNMDKYTQKSIIDLEKLWLQYERIIKDDGAIVLTASQPFTSVLVTSNPELYKYNWIWKKNKAANHVTVGYQPLKVHEDILIFSKAGVNTGAETPIKYNPQDVIWGEEVKYRTNDVKKSGTYRYNSLKAGEFEVKGSNYPTTILEFDVPLKDRVHETQKPTRLFEYLIKTYTDEGDWVHDSCLGSGTTLEACMNTNRNCLGFELKDDWVEHYKKRLKFNTPKLDTFL